MGFYNKMKEWDSGVEHEELRMQKLSEGLGCFALVAVAAIIVWAIWHFAYSDAVRLSSGMYVFIACVFVLLLVFIFFDLYREYECWYIDYEGFHVITYDGSDNHNSGILQTFLWEDIWNLEFKYYSALNDEYTSEGDDCATWLFIMETTKGEKIVRVIGMPLSEFKDVCRRYHPYHNHRWFA